MSDTTLRDEIEITMLAIMLEEGIEPTVENQVAFLHGIRNAMEEDETVNDTQKALVSITISLMITHKQIRAMRNNSPF